MHALKDDLERLHWQVWMDHEIHGGEQWWREIIDTILQAKVFLFALSDASWRSRPCQEELDYAKKLGLPVLPVQVGPVHNLRIPIMETQAIDYRERTPEAVLALVAALADLASRDTVLPDPLPDPPGVPFEYLYRMAERLGPKPIPVDDQELLIAQFRTKLRNEDDDVARADIVKLLKELRRRKELTVGNSEEVDSLLETAERAVVETEEGATRLPPTDHWRQGRTETRPLPEQQETRQQETKQPEVRQPETGRQETGQPPSPPTRPPKRVRKPEPPQPPRPAHQWPSTTRPATPEPPKTEPVEQNTVAAPANEPKTDEAPVWLRSLVTNGATTPPQQQPQTSSAPTPRWWEANQQQKPVPPPEPRTAPKPRHPLAFAGAVLGATGLPFLFFAGAQDDRTAERVGVVLLMVTVALGLSLALVSLARKEPRSRTAVAIAGVGLGGVLLFAALSGVF